MGFIVAKLLKIPGYLNGKSFNLFHYFHLVGKQFAKFPKLYLFIHSKKRYKWYSGIIIA